MYITDFSAADFSAADDYDDYDVELSVKVVIVGNGAVGKSSLIQRYCRGVFTNGYKKTIGVDFLEKHIRVMSQDVRLMLWDTAGQEEFDAITKAYYRGAQACVVAFSTTDRASFEAVRKWKRKVEDECGPVPMALVQNKIDLMHQSQVENEEVERLSLELGMRLFRTSVKEDLNVGVVFSHLADNYVESVRGGDDEYDSNYNSYSSSNRASYHIQPTMQIGVGPRSLLLSNHHPATANGRQRQQQKQQQQRHSKTSFAPPSSRSLYRQPPPPPPPQPFLYPTSPQDYLNNPMFDSLYSHRRRRVRSGKHRFMSPSSSSESDNSNSGGVITLGGYLSRNGIKKKSSNPLVSNCKVL